MKQKYQIDTRRCSFDLLQSCFQSRNHPAVHVRSDHCNFSDLCMAALIHQREDRSESACRPGTMGRTLRQKAKDPDGTD